MTHLSLFSGIGGFDLAAEWAGFKTVAFVERDPFCQKVLAKNFPGTTIYDDVATFSYDRFATDHLARQGYNDGMACQNPKYHSAIDIYYETKSIAKTAAVFGISRQGMHDVLKARGCKFFPRERLGSDNVFYRGGDEAADSAQNKLEKAVKRGDIIRPSECELCGSPDKKFKDGRTSIQAHHPDYEKPLEVTWLCQRCHHKTHRESYLKSQKEVTQVEAAPVIDLITGGFP